MGAHSSRFCFHEFSRGKGSDLNTLNTGLTGVLNVQRRPFSTSHIRARTEIVPFLAGVLSLCARSQMFGAAIQTIIPAAGTKTAGVQITEF